MRKIIIGAVFAALCTGCPDGGDKPKKDDAVASDDKNDAKKDDAKKDDATKADKKDDTKPAADKKDDAKDDKAAKADVNSNKPPTLDEWNAQTKEVAVTGSSALNCETKMVRTWLRVSCRGKNDTGGTPTTLKLVTGGGDGKTFTFAQNDVTSLVLPFVEGVDVKAEFGWTDKKMQLHVWWPRGAPEPPPKGKFTPL